MNPGCAASYPHPALRATLSPLGRGANNKGEETMFEFVTQHQFWAAVGIYWIFSAAVSSMPGPMPNGSPGYLWVYRFLHTVAGNVTTVFGSKIPGAATTLLLAIVLLSPVSGGALHYTMHPA